MGTRLSRFMVRPGENEQIEAKIQLSEEPRSVIHGVVVDGCYKPIQDAVVKLFEKHSCHSAYALKAITHAFTDDCGQFLFGPLDPWQDYVI